MPKAKQKEWFYLEILGQQVLHHHCHMDWPRQATSMVWDIPAYECCSCRKPVPREMIPRLTSQRKNSDAS